MAQKAVVLLSGGLDSAFNIYKAHQELDVVLALTFNYGQRAAQREIQAAKKICDLLGVRHHVVDLPFFHDFTTTSLVNLELEPPKGEAVKIADHQTSEETAKQVWVPNRNGILLNIGAAYAEGLDAEWLIPGFNAEEASTFPDNSEDFMHVMDHSLSYSTANHVKVKCYSVNLQKPEIVKEGRKLDLPFDVIWPCYFASEEICRECESCQRYLRALGE